MKRLLLHILAIFVPILIYGQTYTSVLKGTIIDKDSRQPLVGVNVAVVGVSPVVGATTDDKGFFAIRGLPTGRVNIKMTYIGYEDAYMGQILVGTGKETYVNIEMQEKVNSMQEVVVDGGKDKSRPNNNFATVSATSFSVEQTKRYAGTLNDPSRMVQTFPGVVSSGDDNNAIVIRGNSPRGLLWRMEGIEIPNPNHFAGSEGSTGGGVSILSANMLANTDFYTGAFPAQYGNATSGVFDLNLRKGNQDKREYTLQVGVLGLEAALEGPFSKKYKGSYLINYRYSTLNILALMGLPIGGNQVPKYQDLSFNFSFPTKHIGNFTFFGIGGISSLGNTAGSDTNKFVTLSDRTEEKLGQKVGVVGVTHTFLFKDHKTSLKSVLSLSGTDNGYGEDTVDNQLIKAPLQNNSFRYVYIRGATNLNRKVDTRNTVMAGVSFQIINYRLHQDGLNDTTGVYSTQIDTRGLTYLLEGYWQWRHRFSDRLFLSGGLHFTYGGINNKFYVEPRVGGEYRLTEKMNLTAGIGLHSRMDAVSTYMSQLPAGSTYDLNQNRHLDFSRSAHFVLGYNWNFAKDFRLRAEVYYQYLFSVPVGVGANGYFSVINLNDGFVNMPLVSTGKGRNYGLEITVEKYFTHNYYFLYTLSLFDSKYKGTDGVWRNTIYNSNYVMNLLGGKEFIVGKRKINRIGVNAKIIWRGGTRDTPIDLSASEAAGTTVYDNSQTNAIRLPDYFRVDFGANYRRNKKKYDWMLSLDIQNVINRENVAYRSYDRYAHAIVYKRNLGIIPVLSYKVEF
ncbi:MAG: carboxypeptidase-like regulatory domain-containing protein [Bacteroidetes bacterium]|nr:carboxypeptidase-like regulatory domain-containing protein [Bacteroidota bacterium]